MSQGITFKFGKYKNIDINQVIEKDLGYCNWIINQPNFQEKNKRLFDYMVSNGVVFDKDYEKKKQERNDYKGKYFTFGKYKGELIIDILENDWQYCKYIVSLDNVRKYHSQTVDSILEFLDDFDNDYSNR